MRCKMKQPQAVIVISFVACGLISHLIGHVKVKSKCSRFLDSHSNAPEISKEIKQSKFNHLSSGAYCPPHFQN